MFQYNPILYTYNKHVLNICSKMIPCFLLTPEMVLGTGIAK